MAFRNPNEGMSRFLGSIGDMRRVWEQEQRQKEADARTAEEHKVRMERAAQEIAFAKTAEERANLEANARRLLDPLQREDYGVRIEGGRLQNAGQKTQNKLGEFNLTQAPIIAAERTEAHKSGLETNAAQRAAAAVARALDQGRLDIQNTVNQELFTNWGKPANDLPGAPTWGQAFSWGGIDRTPWAHNERMLMQQYEDILRLASWGGATEAQLKALNDIRAKMQLPPITMQQLLGFNKRSTGSENVILDLINRTEPGGTSSGVGTGNLGQAAADLNQQRRESRDGPPR